MRSLPVEGLVATPFARPPSLIDGLVLSKSLNVLTGKPGAGKTMLLMHMLLKLDTQEAVFGSRATAGGRRCLFVGADAPMWYYHMQLNMLWAGLGAPTKTPTSLFLHTNEKLISPTFLAFPPERNITPLVGYIEDLIEHEGINTIAFDTLRRFHSLNERDDQHAAHFMEWLKYWRDKFDLTIFFAHHERKPMAGTADTGTDRARGSTEWTASFDGVFSIAKFKRYNKYRLDCSKVRGFPEDELPDLWLEFNTKRDISIEIVTTAGPGVPTNHAPVLAVWPKNLNLRRSDIIQQVVAAGMATSAATVAVDSAIAWLRRNNHLTSRARGWWSRTGP